ncbi:hypothetical protein GTQ40_08320 [Flavobacteriaceae bacterium R38]|nr:hypothetical protein [Flavobacteriaceae bacterium R38]
MKTFKTFFFSLLTMSLLVSCVKDSLDEDPLIPDNGEGAITAIEDLIIPNGFEFQTERSVNLNINDAQNGTRYVVLVNGNQVANKLIVQGEISASLNIPATTSKLTLLRRTARSLEEISISANGSTISYNYSN